MTKQDRDFEVDLGGREHLVLDRYDTTPPTELRFGHHGSHGYGITATGGVVRTREAEEPPFELEPLPPRWRERGGR